jgi:hypothetical protein
MQLRGLKPLEDRHPIAGRSDRSWFAGLAALGLGAFLAGGWVAAVGVLFVVRVGQSLLRRFANSAGHGGPGGGGTLGLI